MINHAMTLKNTHHSRTATGQISGRVKRWRARARAWVGLGAYGSRTKHTKLAVVTNPRDYEPFRYPFLFVKDDNKVERDECS